ncbi:hypothetical protein AQUCO_00100501v1 [Aquilegia coerulea]|uniref:Uncharacterized protein n=1 Tax=Aquilegia coerulea TaxID=218851 RepID=A0A2G5FAK6_AQUCA|nr:hypothetical protein AQUCO_00100501v1 [Aquilegia coerulea]
MWKSWKTYIQLHQKLVEVWVKIFKREDNEKSKTEEMTLFKYLYDSSFWGGAIIRSILGHIVFIHPYTLVFYSFWLIIEDPIV